MLEDNALLSRIVSRFHIIVTVVVALAAAAFLGISAGEGDFFGIYVGIFGAAFIALMIALGDKYWMVIPFAFTSQLPAVPIRGRLLELPEITAALCTVVFLIRYAVKRQTLSIFRREHAIILLYVGWAAMVFSLNPVGLSGILEGGGGALGGARFYAKILLGLAAFLVMANQVITETDCKRILVILIVGAVLSSGYAISLYFLPALGSTMELVGESSSYSWHQQLGIVPLLLIMLGFSRYRTGDLFSLNRTWITMIFGVCLVLIGLSGKRTALASVIVVAISAALLRREWGYLMFWLAGATVASGIIIIGHGSLFRLPTNVQRALSVLPATWDAEFQYMEGGQDTFRAELRRLAWKKIEQDPWIGTGYQVDLSLSQALSAQYAMRGGDTELQVTPFAMGSSWHNTWLGHAADFGIPLAVIAAGIYLSVIRRGLKLLKSLPTKSFAAALSMYLLLNTVRRLVFSHVGGHSATEPFEFWWFYGLQVTLLLRLPSQLKPEPLQNPVNHPAQGRRMNPRSPGVPLLR